MAQMCPAKSTIVPFKKQMYSSGSIILSYKDDKCICVSIHAPTRGATSSFIKTQKEMCFNPRTHEGCDLLRLLRASHQLCFNPRTHEGCDLLRHQDKPRNVVSIHAPTRGATPKSHQGARRNLVSIHAPTRGATGRPLLR